MRQADRNHRILIAAVVVAGLATALAPRIAQDLAYHEFADQRPLLGVPNSLNVLSNLAFVIVGLTGLAVISRIRSWERWPYAAFFAGTALTSIGSAYYHLAPDNWRLVWDRLPMTVGFMGLLTAVIAERVNNRAARTLFAPLLVLGTASVAYWYWSEVRGAGDLRPYALVQFGSLLAIVVALLFDPRNLDNRYFFLGLGAYLLAKAFEFADRPIYEAWNIISGHTIKHLMAAVGLWFIVMLLRQRAATDAVPRVPRVPGPTKPLDPWNSRNRLHHYSIPASHRMIFSASCRLSFPGAFMPIGLRSGPAT